MAEYRLQVVFDYVDPGSYLVYQVLQKWVQEKSETWAISWIPLELRPPSSLVIDPASSPWEEMTAAMEVEALAEGIPFRRPARVPRTRKAHELALHAREKGFFEEVHRAIFEAHFVHGSDIGRVDVLTTLAEQAGLDPGETRTVLGVDRFLEEVEELRGHARERGVRGVPTIDLSGHRIEGFEGAEALRGVLERMAIVED